MSCFWQGLVSKVPALKGMPVSDVCKHLQSVNELVDEVSWNGIYLTEKQQQENFLWIKAYDAAQYDQGHWTSACDPFLALSCQIFCINIDHVYDGTTLVFRHPRATNKVTFVSSTSHFS